MFQRESLAKALGMEVNQLANMFKKQKEAETLAARNQKTLNRLKKEGVDIDLESTDIKLASLAEIALAAEEAGKSEAEIRKILGDTVIQRKEELGAQQKFAEALEKAKPPNVAANIRPSLASLSLGFFSTL